MGREAILVKAHTIHLAFGTHPQSKPLSDVEKKPSKRHDKVVTWVETHPSNANEMLTASAGELHPCDSNGASESCLMHH